MRAKGQARKAQMRGLAVDLGLSGFSARLAAGSWVVRDVGSPSLPPLRSSVSKKVHICTTIDCVPS
jgi:hypothetical protein